MAFPPFENSDHVVVSVSIDFPSNSQRDALFHHIAYDYFHADWDGLLRDAQWKYTFKLSACAATSEFCQWVQIVINVYIPHRKDQAKPHSSTWFSAACAAAIVHKSYFFRLYQQNKSLESNVKLKQASNRYKRVLEAAKFDMLLKQKSIYFPGTLLSRLLVNSHSVLDKGKFAIPPLFNGPEV